MKWQEYQHAVAELYRSLGKIGKVKESIRIPDMVTGQPRQVDVWLEIQAKTHRIGILIDAKLRRHRVNVKDVEEVLGLAKSVGANKAVIVTTRGWTKPAEQRARFSGMDLRLYTIDEALKAMVEDYWMLCPVCEDDCVILNTGQFILDGLFFWWFAGRCRKCRAAVFWCQDCGWQEAVEYGRRAKCSCGHLWGNDREDLWIRFVGTEERMPLLLWDRPSD